jgi:sugar-specific transcriptional regulator TrmB
MVNLSSEMSDINRLLQEFGLPEVATRIYISLISGQPQTILEMAAELKIPRTSVYDNVQKLQEKGLVEKIVTFKSQKIAAQPIEYLQTAIEVQRAKLDRLGEKLGEIKEILAHKQVNVPETQVRYYKGAEGIRQIMWNVLKADKQTVGYSEFGRMEVIGREFTERWSDEFRERKLVDRVITNPTIPVKKYIKNVVLGGVKHQLDIENIRFFPQEKLYITGDTTIYNNIYAVCYWRQGEVVGVELENPEFVKTQKTMFELLWKLAKPI